MPMEFIANTIDKEVKQMEGYKDILGKRIHYIKKGSGEPLILLHGLGGSILQWTQNIDYLSRYFTVYAFDFPGFGQSAPVKDYELNISFVPMFMEETRKVFEIENPTIVGSSVAGLFAIDYALYFPENVNKLVLVNSAGLGKDISWFWKIATIPGLGELLWKFTTGTVDGYRWLWRFSSVPLLESIIEELHEKAERNDDKLDDIRPENEKNGLRFLRYGVSLFGQRKTLNRFDELSKLLMPTLIVWGEQDDILSVEQGVRASKVIPNAALRIIKNAGHVPYSDSPEEFNEAIKNFVLSQ